MMAEVGYHKEGQQPGGKQAEVKSLDLVSFPDDYGFS
jgi:hypothetical protein